MSKKIKSYWESYSKYIVLDQFPTGQELLEIKDKYPYAFVIDYEKMQPPIQDIQNKILMLTHNLDYLSYEKFKDFINYKDKKQYKVNLYQQASLQMILVFFGKNGFNIKENLLTFVESGISEDLLIKILPNHKKDLEKICCQHEMNVLQINNKKNNPLKVL